MLCRILLGVTIFAMFLCERATAQEGYYGIGHDKWHHGFYMSLRRNDARALVVALQIVAPRTLDRNLHCSRRAR
jgi:hypothetical protein